MEKLALAFMPMLVMSFFMTIFFAYTILLMFSAFGHYRYVTFAVLNGAACGLACAYFRARFDLSAPYGYVMFAGAVLGFGLAVSIPVGIAAGTSFVIVHALVGLVPLTLLLFIRIDLRPLGPYPPRR